MRVLVLNSGSATLKFQLRDIDAHANVSGNDATLARGLVERIGGAASYRFERNGSAEEHGSLTAQDHQQAVNKVLEWLARQLESASFEAVGHRIVHGGDRFPKSVLLDEGVIASLDQLNELAPLHNPGSLSGIHAARKSLGEKIPMAAVFDTSFHRTIPLPASTYAI